MTVTELYVGLMSGTSVDAVDAVLMDFASGPRLRGHSRTAFPADLRQDVVALFESGPDEIARAGSVHNRLATLYAEAVASLLAGVHLASRDIKALGCHGQTVRHEPDIEPPYTLQLGNPSLLAELSGVAVVADFRARDMAAGGQGAPLAPAFHAAFFSHPGRRVAVLNLGGIANISLLAPGSAPGGFDVGPGNVLLDLVARQRLGQPHDHNGEAAAAGTVIEPLLRSLAQEPFFGRPPPKSTGRELFNERWLRRACPELDQLPAANLLATLSELTAATVARAVAAMGVDELLIGGGGARNAEVVARLRRRLPRTLIETTAARGLDPELVEGAGFAWLARQHLLGLAGNCPAATGAAGPRILGGLYPA